MVNEELDKEDSIEINKATSKKRDHRDGQRKDLVIRDYVNNELNMISSWLKNNKVKRIKHSVLPYGYTGQKVSVNVVN